MDEVKDGRHDLEAALPICHRMSLDFVVRLGSGRRM